MAGSAAGGGGSDGGAAYYDRIGLMVGLEIHQQLATGRKLFCSCRQDAAGGAAQPGGFTRSLRASKSEAGGYDPAAVFEGGRARTIAYRRGAAGTSCLVEEDDEPPHGLDAEAVRTALIVAAALGSRAFRELFPMRKMVIDGSNTSGFQRTMLVSQGGSLRVPAREGEEAAGPVGVQSVCLEEDAARLLGDSGGMREYCLDRLGIPLVEIALDPVRASPGATRRIAVAAGRMLRATGRVARGIGTIRQDVNVSVGGGPVVEVKGVQQLDQLEKVVEFEARRQDGLNIIAGRLRRGRAGRGEEGRGAREGPSASDVTEAMSGCASKIVRRAVAGGGRIIAVRAPGFGGMLGYEPHRGIRLGREIAQAVRPYGIGGVFHTDELPAYGIAAADVAAAAAAAGCSGDGDAMILLAAPPSVADAAAGRVVERIEQARRGVPAETRQARQDGTTAYLRPRPGPARMYPETDIPPVAVTEGDLGDAAEAAPPPWDESVARLSKRHGLNAQLAEQVLDSGRAGLLESVCADRRVPPNFAASAMCSTLAALQRREGLDAGLLDDSMIAEAFAMLAEGRVTKDSIGEVFEAIMSGASRTVEDAARSAAGGAGAAGDDEVSRILDELLAERSDYIDRAGERAVKPIMGAAMARLRGRAQGSDVSRMLAGKMRARIGAKKEKKGSDCQA